MKWMLLAALAAATVGGATTARLEAPEAPQPCAAVVAVVGDAPVTCELQPGDRLDVLDVGVIECLDMGGTLRPDPDAEIGNVDCEDVDF